MHWSRQLDTELFRPVEVCSVYPLVNSGCHYPTLHSDQNKTATQLYHQQQSSQQKKSNLLLLNQTMLCLHMVL